MRVKLGNALFAAAVGVGLFTGTASAQNVDWATCGTSPPACSATQTSCCTESAANLNFGQASGDKAIIIPMDRCHQPMSTPSTHGAPGAAAPAWCAGSPAADSDGMFHAYGLVYRLMQRGVPVYWIVNPTKHASGPANYGNLSDHVYYEDDIDLWILHSSQSSANVPTGAGTLTACPSAAEPTCSGPVSFLNDNLTPASTYAYKEFPLRGSVFVIPGVDTDGDTVSDRAEFNSFWTSYGNGSSGKACGSGTHDCYDFTSVALYEVNATARPFWKNWTSSSTIAGLPIAVKLNYKPPRIARVKSGGNVSNLFLEAANLNDPADPASCNQGIFVRNPVGTLPYEPVVCDVNETGLYNNSLVTGNFGWAWFDGGANFGSCSRALQSVRTYITGLPGLYYPGNVMVNDSRLEEFEECANHQLLGRYGAAYAGSAGALRITNSVNETDDQPFMIRYPTNLFAQYGDLPMDFASSSTGSWTSGSTWGYNTLFTGAAAGSNTLKRLLTREASAAAGNPVCGDNNGDGDLASGGGSPDAGDKPHWYDVFPHANASSCDTAADNEDVATYGRFNNDPLNGVVFYMPGNNLSNNGVRGQLRMLLNSLLATPSGSYTPASTTPYEVSRSSPIVPQIPAIGGPDYIVQGTYVVQDPSPTAPVVNGDADIGNFYFPFRVGHMRARLATATSTVLFDAGCNSALGASFACPAGSTGIPTTGRVIFTNSQGGDLRSATQAYKVSFNTSMTTTLKDLISTGAVLSTATIDTIISRVISGYPTGTPGVYTPALGGVDRSTVAIVQASEAAPDGANRPMMAYFGASDGMLHAVCVEQSGTCDEGKELWAFLPRKMLPHLRTNTARIDGSPRVLDAYIDPDGTGGQPTEWRTVLVFQTGMGDYTMAGREPAVYALDITDPFNPMLLWEMADSQPGTYSLGVGLTMSAGTATIAGANTYMAWAQTNNLGTSGPGSVITAINLETGAKYRQALFQFNPNPRTSSNDPVARSAIPAGTVPLDLPSGATGRVTHLLFDDVYGRMWLVDPDTLVSTNGANTPLFTMSADYYAMGSKPAIFAQGGSQYAVFTTGGYADPSNTTWPIACCSSANGSSCDGTQPNPPRVCSQYNNSTAIFPTQMAVAVKIDTAVTSSFTVPGSACDTSATPDPTTSVNYPACPTGFLFRRDLGRDQRGSSTTSALVVGTDIFLTTESDNVNRTGYGTTGGNTGNLYAFSSTSGVQTAAPTAVVLGSGGPAVGNAVTAGARTVYSGNAVAGSSSTSGQNVTANSATGVTRRVWLRTE